MDEPLYNKIYGLIETLKEIEKRMHAILISEGYLNSNTVEIQELREQREQIINKIFILKNNW